MFVGRDVPKVDALEKAAGKACFSYDLKTEEMLFACAFRSTRPHASIRNIDTRDALALPGIVGILSAKDIPGQNLFGAIRKDQPYLADGIVRFRGEPILVVIGKNEEIARKALTLIKVDYAEITPIMSTAEADASPLFLHKDGNLLCYRSLRKGDI